eukprot:356529-Chlamydomonas_euryale.AAC.1
MRHTGAALPFRHRPFLARPKTAPQLSHTSASDLYPPPYRCRSSLPTRALSCQTENRIPTQPHFRLGPLPATVQVPLFPSAPTLSCQTENRIPTQPHIRLGPLPAT